MQELVFFKEVLEQSLHRRKIPSDPKRLYEPVQYILSLGGKRLRPVLTLLTCDFFSEDYKKAIDAALAVELFHNFSLIHDDIMDAAPLRRGKETVHAKWDLNTGILSGDAMLILAYQYFENYEPKLFLELAKLFSKTALEVCEGQQYDIDFETRNDVTISEYLKMIEYKTAVLVGAAMKMGAIVAGASNESKEAIYDFGRNLGIAFQLQDDYLDAYGNPDTFGKQVGGDIIANKKTFLYLTAMEGSSSSESSELVQLFNMTPKDPSEKVKRVKSIFESSGAVLATEQKIAYYTEKASLDLEQVQMTEVRKEKLREFGRWLMARTV
jgi:geranylgeranyl diphosphate synthase, type II